MFVGALQRLPGGCESMWMPPSASSKLRSCTACRFGPTPLWVETTNEHKSSLIVSQCWLSNYMVNYSELSEVYGWDWTAYLVGGKVNLDIWGTWMESTDENSGHESYVSISSAKTGPSGGERATWNRLMWPRRSRMSDWASLFIRGLIALLSTSHRCAVCAEIIALCVALLAAREQSQRS